MQIRDPQHLVGFGVVHDWLELQSGANVNLSTSRFFNAKEPDIGIQTAATTISMGNSCHREEIRLSG